MEQPTQKKIVEYPERNYADGFDLRTHIKDANTGQTIRTQHYTLHLVGGKEYFERPCGSGNLFFRGGEEAGRWEQDKDGKWGAIEGKAHGAFMEPKTHLVRTEDIMNENEVLRAELAALKAQSDAKLSEKAVPTMSKGQAALK